jgi:hypothetical protein
MKLAALSFLLATSFASSSALASPAVGDYAKYAGKMGETAFTQEVTLTGFDAAANTFEQKTVNTWAGEEPQTLISSEDAANLPTEAQIEETLAKCAELGGTPESVQVAAGAFDTCKLPQNDGHDWTWVGKVPFGVVKADFSQEDGSRWVYELTEQKRGQ